MTNPSNGGASKVLVNASAGSKGAAGGKKKSLQSKNVPDSRSSAPGGPSAPAAASSSTTTSSAGGGFQSFFRWFRRDESRALARSTSGSEVTPELLDRRVPCRQRQPQPQSPSSATRPGAATPVAVSNVSRETSVTSNGTHSSSPSPGPVIDCNNLSKSSSCDSILSTATNGFAFVPPNCYEAVLAGARVREPRTIQPGPYTDSYKRRCWQRDCARELDRKNELTLRKKYRLFGSLRDSPKATDQQDATLTRANQRAVYADLSLPTGCSKVTGAAPTACERSDATDDEPHVGDPNFRRHRRTVSDSSKDRRAGAYVHVKGKRKAPPPPPLTLDPHGSGTLTRSSTSTNYYGGTLSPGSTLSRKKRPAPAPPLASSPTLNEASSSTSLLEDREIKAIIEGRPLPARTPLGDPDPIIMPFIRPLSPLPPVSEERAPPGGLTEEQKQQLIDNIRRVQAVPGPPRRDACDDVMKMEEQFSRTNGTRSPIHDYLYAEAIASSRGPAPAPTTAAATPTSPISPRPWYKRPISGMRHQESSLPFKRDIILKTIDKRKHSSKGDSGDADLPEVGYCRNSLVATGLIEGGGGSPSSSLGGGGKFNLFSRITEKSDDTKRRERDAEKRRSAIGIPSISELDREAAEIIHNESYRSGAGATEKPQSTKELISKFEATIVPTVGKVTVSSTFVARRDFFGVVEPQKVVAPADTKKSSPLPTVAPQVTGPKNELSKTGSDKNLLGLWMCPYCTLENPNWRIICEACERIKPYDSKLSILEEPPLHPNHPLRRPIPDAHRAKPQVSGETGPTTTTTTGGDAWDKKTEQVLKYFMPKPSPGPATNGTLLVGVANAGDDRAAVLVPPPQRKTPFGQTKLLASPKMGIKSLMSRAVGGQGDTAAAGTSFRNFNAIPEAYQNGTGGSNKFDDQKLKESKPMERDMGSVAPLASPEPTEDGGAVTVSNHRMNIEEIRNARIARFGVAPDTDRGTAKPKEQQDQEDLEKEKERLREMIRAMNAKALAEKYPVVQKPPVAANTSTGGSANTSTTSTMKRDSPLVQRKNGLTSGIPISTKSLSPLPRRKGESPLLARKSPATSGAIEDPGTKKEPLTVRELAPGLSPNTGAIRKTSFPRLGPEPIEHTEGKIMNQDQRAAPFGTIPETVAELSQPPPPPPATFAAGGPSLVLTNDIQGIHYEPMDEQQYTRSTTHQQRVGESAIPLSPRLQDRHRKSLLEKQQQHDERVRLISDQLRSQQGVERFRSTLALAGYPGSNMGRTGTLALNKLLRNLEQAIGDGAHDRAAELAMDLAKMKVSLSVTRQSPQGAGSERLNVYIDDKMSHKGPLRMKMAAFGTLGQLKQKLCNDYQLPVAVQRWRWDDRPLEEDAKTLFDYGIQTNDQTLHVYLVQPAPTGGQAIVDRQAMPQQTFSRAEAKLLSVSSESSDGEHSDTQNDDTVLGAAALPVAAPRGKLKPEPILEEPASQEGWVCPMCTLINEPQRPGCAACSGARPSARRVQPSITVTPEDLKRFLDEQPPLGPGRVQTTTTTTTVQLRNPPPETRNDLNRISANRKSSEIFNILLDESKAVSAQPGALPSPAPVPKPRTTTTPGDLVRPVHIQVPEQSRIVMTAFTSHRSPNITRSQYRGVDNFNPNSSGLSKPERPIISTASPIVRAVLLKQSHAERTQSAVNVRFGRNGLALPEDGTEVLPNHYTELVNLDNADLIANIEPFECPICFGAFQPYEGIVLRDCLHSFCKQCLISTIQYGEDAEIRCPYSDTVYSCESVIQQREIKALVSKELYEAHLAKSIQQAESTIDNTFHCRTPNCRGWCIFEDNVNQFKCPVCTIVNCLTCRVIHDGLDCKQYQDRMNSDCDTNLEARRTKAMLQEMVEKGDALNCPTCQIVVTKISGCDGITCTMCKTEICWATRGPRWGPAGKGDTSGGCRCGFDGIKCTPQCKNCH
ncbi:uncharacterized protein LOC128271275 [Anopheles cruzii]|uniref:uncharacterized protein LOC128271275 n=1 Tax=Anopheles cruzii TaxID=68878 RepID=UPI0022EC996D|nr:uncharacterized protein LOC128271275 [Anopheles cruzii]